MSEVREEFLLAETMGRNIKNNPKWEIMYLVQYMQWRIKGIIMGPGL